MLWEESWRADPRAKALADRHYSRQNPEAKQFMPPGGCVVLFASTATGQAVWGTSTPLADFVKHRWAGAWMNTLFRNEGAGLSSELIRQAVAATRAALGEPPRLGLVTFVDAGATVRGRSAKSKPGECYRHAGFQHVGYTTERGYWAWQLLPADMPPPHPAKRPQYELAL